MPSSDRIDELKKRYDENPRRFFASLANEYRKAGDLEQAITLCQTHLADQPSNMNGHVVYGQALFEAGRYDEAKVTFETALTLDPENLIALRHLGDISCTNGANEEAREWYARVLDADPRNDEIIALLANIEEQVNKDKMGAPVAATPVSDPTPVSHPTPVSDPTPVVPIDSIDTVQIEAVKPPAPAPDMGLMDLAIDFDSIPDGSPTSLGASAEPEPDLMMDPFADPAPAEFEAWTPPVVENPRATFDPLPPVAEANTSIRTDVDDLFGDSLPAEPAAPFVTETMAELYLQQGFTNEALEVYRQLSEQSPDDERLRTRVQQLERGERTSVSLDSTPEPESYNTADEVPLGGMLDFDATPVVAQAPIDEIEQGEEPAPEPEPEAPAPPRTARTYFAALSSRKAEKSNGRARTAPRVSAPRVPVPRISGAALTAPSLTAVGLTAPVSVTSLDELFAGGIISDRDELVANAFAQVAGAAEMGASEVKGKPTAPAATELSLDSVFKDVDARATPAATATVPRQSQNLRFDQFFSTSAEDSAPAAPPAASAPVGEPGSPAEIKQFQSWLTGLKKP